MTERLTEKWFDDMEQIYRYAPKSPNIEINCGGDDFQRIIDKLAEYEAAEEDGILWIFPVAIGDQVYVIDKYINSGEWHLSNYEHIVTDILLNQNREPLFKITNRYGTEKLENFGKTVFLTREEAEKALKDRQEKPIALSSKIILDKQ